MLPLRMVVLEDPESAFICLQMVFPLSVQFRSLGGSVHFAYTQFTASLGLNIECSGMAMAFKKANRACYSFGVLSVSCIKRLFSERVSWGQALLHHIFPQNQSSYILPSL